MNYQFRREDDGAVVEVDWELMMTQDRAGFITLPDGVAARRVYIQGGQAVALISATEEAERLGRREVLDQMGLGFGQHQLAQMEEDRIKNGFGDIEFVRDADVPEYLNVKCANRGAWERYAKHRGFVDRNRNRGLILSADELKSAGERAIREANASDAARRAAGL